MKKSIDFLITQKCNYRCPYCSQSKGYSKNLEEADDSVISAFLKFLNEIPRDFEITISGGEPLTHKKFFYLIEELKKLGFMVSIVSNFSYPIEEYKKIKDILGDNLSEILASLHLSQIKSLDDYLSKALEFNLYKGNSNFKVASVLSNDNCSELKKVAEFAKNNNLNFELQHMRIKNSFVEYNKEAKDFIKDYPISKIKEISNTIGKKCSAGRDFLVIYQNGECYRCYSSRFNKIHSMGNIKKGIKLFEFDTPCLNKKCTCPKPIMQGMIDYNSNMPFKTALLSLYNAVFVPYYIIKNFDIVKAKLTQSINFKK